MCFPTRARFALLIPVKALARAKSRLEVEPAHRVELMRSFAQDALAAALRSPAVHQVYVVTSEPFDTPGVRMLEDEGAGDLNAALRHAERRVRREDPDHGVAAMCADLPALDTADLTAALSWGASPRWFVADATGSGTTLLAAERGVDLDPHFGALSARRHAQSGAAPLLADLRTLRQDVDTDSDLVAARQLGVGANTLAVLVT